MPAMSLGRDNGIARILHHAVAGDPRAKAMIVGVHGKNGEKEIAGHGRIHFSRIRGCRCR